MCVKLRLFRKQQHTFSCQSYNQDLGRYANLSSTERTIIYDFKNEVVGCIHAGWKGAITGIIKNTVNKIKKINSDNKIIASIGPCIGKNSYEVDLIFYKRFLYASKRNNKYFFSKNKNKKLFNLRKFIADELITLGVGVDHVNHDTFSEKNNFFSYRRSSKLKQNDYGRCISVVRLIQIY